MPARVALSSTQVNGQYVGTTRVAPPTAGPGSNTCRLFNGQSDRLLLGPSNALGSNFVVLLSFWRSNIAQLPDNQTSARLFTQYCVGGTRVAVGLNRNSLSLTYTSGSQVYTLESPTQLVDTNRHILALAVIGTNITVMLDGRVAIKIAAVLPSPDLALVCVGADVRSRFFQGYIDDVAVFKNPHQDLQNWVRYYRNLVLGRFDHDYQSSPFASGYHSVALSEDGFTASGGSQSPRSRVPVAVPFIEDTVLPVQAIEFRFGSTSGEVKIGLFNSAHDLENFDIGESPESYAFTQNGEVWQDSAVVSSGFGNWLSTDTMAMRWEPSTRVLALLRNGEFMTSVTLPAGQWTAAVSLGQATVTLNSGDTVARGLPLDTPGLPLKAWSRLTTELRKLRIDGVSSALDEQGVEILDSATGSVVGEYYSPEPREPGFTVESLDLARRVGGGIRVGFGPYTAADDEFFFAIAFSPEEEDLTGEVVLLESPTKWGLRLIDGKLNAWVGSVQVGSSNEPFTPGDSYFLGLTRSAAGRLLVWSHIGYILQSGDLTVSQTATDLWVGSAADGSKKFSGRLSHLVLSSNMLPQWKLQRLRSVYTWDLPDIAGMIPNPPVYRRVTELSWADVVAAGISSSPTSSHCYVGTLAQAPDSIAIEYRPVDRKGAAGYTGDNIHQWCPSAVLLQELDESGDQLYLMAADGLESVLAGTPALIDNEIFKVTAVNLVNSIVHVARACADTVPGRHGAGAKVWFYGSAIGSSRNVYQVLDSVDVKLLSRTELAEMGEEFAPTDTISMQGRLARPYPPAGLTVNDQLAPAEISGTAQIKWLSRNKASQGSTLLGWTEPGPAAPAGTTYRVRAYNPGTSELVFESDPIASNDLSYNLFVDGYVGQLAVTVTSYLAGQESLWSARLEFDYNYEVMVILNTEEGEALETEDETANIEAEFLTSMMVGSYNGQLPDDFSGEEEEEEEEDLADHSEGGAILGVKISEFSQLATTPTGEEMIPIAINGTNYFVTFSQYLQWLIANSPQPQDGKNAYQLWLEQGNTGSLDDFFEFYRGYRGLNSNAARRILTITGATGAIVCNWELYDEIRLRLVGNVTLTFQGPADGQGCMLKIQQDATGGRTLTLPPQVRYNALVQSYSPTPTPLISDKIAFIYDSSDGAYDFVTFVPGITY